MRALRTESIFVGDVVDGVSNVGLRIDIGETTANGNALVLLSGVQQLGGLLMSLAVGQFVTELVSINTNVIQRCFLYYNRLVGLVMRAKLRRSCESDSDDSGEGNDLKCK